MFSFTRIHRRIATTALMSAAAAVLAGCGNLVDTTVEGQIGLSLDDNGDLIAHVQTCSLNVREVLVIADEFTPTTTEFPNDATTQYTLISDSLRSGYFTINLTHPGQGWTSDPANQSTAFAPEKLYTLLINAEGKNAQVKQLTVSSKTVQMPGPNEVAVSLYQDQPATTQFKEGENFYGSVGIIPVQELKDICG